MHDVKFNVNGRYDLDFDRPEDAIAHVEKEGSGSVVKFVGSRNLPGCLPETVYRSSCMWSLQDGEWWSHYIFSGTGEKVNREKPH